MNIISIGDVVKKLREEKGLTQEALGELLGVKRASVSAIEKGKSELTLENLQKICNIFNVSSDSVIGRNQHLTQSDNPPSAAGSLVEKIIPIIVDKQNNPVIKMLPYSAQAGYLQEKADPSFWEDLPEVSLPDRKFRNGHYIGVQVWGESMQNTLNGGDWILCQKVENMDHLQFGEIYVVVPLTMSPVVKRIERNIDKSLFTLVSDNSSHEPYQISRQEIVEIWRYDTLIRFHPFTLKK